MHGHGTREFQIQQLDFHIAENTGQHRQNCHGWHQLSERIVLMELEDDAEPALRIIGNHNSTSYELEASRSLVFHPNDSSGSMSKIADLEHTNSDLQLSTFSDLEESLPAKPLRNW